jgi:hypothetical protein
MRDAHDHIDGSFGRIKTGAASTGVTSITSSTALHARPGVGVIPEQRLVEEVSYEKVRSCVERVSGDGCR